MNVLAVSVNVRNTVVGFVRSAQGRDLAAELAMAGEELIRISCESSKDVRYAAMFSLLPDVTIRMPMI